MNNDILFFKVYRNKYIFNVIFNFVESEPDHVDKLSNKRIKFKDLYKLEWFIEKQQFQLLKCKLLNGEYIETDNQSMNSLLSVNNKSTTTMDLQLFKEILELLSLNNEKEWKLKQNQILLKCLKYSNLQIIDILYQFYTGKTIESTVSELTLEQNELYNFILKKILSNENNRDQLLKHTKIKQQQLQRQQLNIYDLFSNSKVESIKYYISNFIHIKLFAACEVDFKIQLYSKNHNTINNQDLIESLYIYISIFKNEQQTTTITTTNFEEESIIIEKLLKEWIIISKSPALFKIYLSRYDKVIEELMDDKEFQAIVMKYSFDNFSYNLLGSFKFTNKKLSEFRSGSDWGNTDELFISKNRTISSNQPNAIEFLKLYLFKLSNEIIPKNEKESNKLLITTKCVLFNLVFGITSPELYNQFLNEIPEQHKQHVPTKWNKSVLEIVKLKHSTVNPEMDEMFVVNDKETIHWIKECNILLKEGAEGFKIVLKPIFATIELAKYAHQILSPPIADRKQSDLFGLKYQKSDFYQYHIFKSIKECNVQDIKSIHSKCNLLSLNSRDFNLFKMEPFSTVKFKHQTNDINYQDYNEILDFIKDNMVRDYTFIQVIDFIVMNGYYEDYNGSGDDVFGQPFFNLSKIKINLHTELLDGAGRKFWSENLLLKFRNYKLSRFILENVYLTLAENEDIRDLPFYDTTRFKSICKNWNSLSPVEIIELVHLFIHQVINIREYINTSSTQPIPSLEIYFSYLNGLFLTLIDDRNDIGLPVTDEQVFEIVQLFNEHSIQFKQDTISKPLLVNVKSKQLYNYYKANGSKYFKLSELSFETILKSSVIELTELIIDRPYMINIQSFKNDNEILNQNLQLFLNLSNTDLFLKELQQLVSNNSDFKIKLNSNLSTQCSKVMDLQSVESLLNFNTNSSNFKNDNQEFFIFMVLQCLKFGRFSLFKYLFKYLNLNNILNTNIDNKFDIYPLISKLECVLKIETKSTKTKRNNFIIHNKDDDF